MRAHADKFSGACGASFGKAQCTGGCAGLEEKVDRAELCALGDGHGDAQDCSGDGEASGESGNIDGSNGEAGPHCGWTRNEVGGAQRHEAERFDGAAGCELAYADDGEPREQEQREGDGSRAQERWLGPDL